MSAANDNSLHAVLLTTLDEALTRWSVVCRTWQDMAAGHQPHLGSFLAGWFARDAGCSIDATRARLQDSVRAGWRECDETIAVKVRQNSLLDGCDKNVTAKTKEVGK